MTASLQQEAQGSCLKLPKIDKDCTKMEPANSETTEAQQSPGVDNVPGRISPVVPPTKNNVMQFKLVKVNAPTCPRSAEKPLQPRVVFFRGPKKSTPVMRWVSPVSDELITQALGSQQIYL